MSSSVAVIFIFGLVLILLALGAPIAFALGASALALGLIVMGIPSVTLMEQAMLNQVNTIVLIALPLFIFMGNILEVSGIAERAYVMAQNWIGGMKGGLAIATVFICTLFAACTGVSGASTVTMGIVALPSMLKRGYDKKLAIGCIMAGGALGVLIPPSVLLILYGFIASESIGRLFAGGVIPGLILSGLFIIYTIVLCTLKPSYGPSIPKEERPGWAEKFRSLKAVLLPIFLIIAVLGSIFSGAATPTEASAVGSFGAIICMLINRSFTWKKLKQAMLSTIALSAMVMWIIVGATAFTAVFSASGASNLVRSTFVNIDVPPIMIVIIMQITFFILGCFMDPAGIALICAPIYVPVIKALGFDGVWFGVLFVVNMEMAYLTPPYGFNLFYMRGILPKEEVSMMDIYKSAIPFVCVQAIGLILVLFIPALATWLPNLLLGAQRV